MKKKHLPIAQESSHASLRSRLLKQTGGSFGLKVMAAGLGFMTSVILARLLGAESFGVYGYAMAWVTLLSIPATLGFKLVLIREVAAYKAQSNWELINGLLRYSNLVVLISSISLTAIGIILACFLFPEPLVEMKWALCLAFISLPISSLTVLRLGAMQGLNNVVLGELPEKIVSPAVFLLFIGGLYFFQREAVNVQWVLILKIVALSIAFIVGALLLRQKLPQAVFAAKPKYLSKKWFSSALPLTVFLSVQIIYSRTDIIMLGILSGAKSVGIYLVVTRLISLISLVFNASNGAIAPMMSSLYAQKDFHGLQKLITQNSQFVSAIALLFAIFIAVFSPWILSIFGENFVKGKNTLFIFCIGSLCRTLSGPAGWLMNMTGCEKTVTIIFTSSAFLNVVLNFLLIPKFGMEGAAIATVISMVFTNITNAVFAYKTVSINSTAFPFLGSKY